MTSMTKLVAALFLSALVCLSVASPAWAQNRWRRTRTAVPTRNAGAYATRTPAQIRTFSPYDSWRYGYPKYDGGFHSRYYLEMLYPTGDRPVRGTAW
jgi:hypothetical protein